MTGSKYLIQGPNGDGQGSVWYEIERLDFWDDGDEFE